MTDPKLSIVDRAVVQVVENANNTASQRIDNISVAVERLHRLHGTGLLHSACKLLSCKASTYATACTIFHRFCHQKSLKEMDVWSAAMATTLLACKIEEDTKPIYQIIVVFARLYRKRRLVCVDDPSPIIQSPHVAAASIAKSTGLSEKQDILRKIKPMSKLGPVYREWYNKIIEVENLVLRQLGFTLYWIPDRHPHKFILYFCRALKIEAGDTTTRAWNYCNDSCRLDLCIRFEPQVIACAAIHLATIDTNNKQRAHWWHELIGPMDKEIPEIGNAILSLQEADVGIATAGFIPSISGTAFNDPDSYLWTVAD